MPANSHTPSAASISAPSVQTASVPETPFLPIATVLPPSSPVTARLTPSPAGRRAPTVTFQNTPSEFGSSGVYHKVPSLVSVREGFEDDPSGWQVGSWASGKAGIERSEKQQATADYSARLTTFDAASEAQLQIDFSDPAYSHQWGERPGTYFWQWAAVYLPAGTIEALGPGEYFTLAAVYPSAGGPYGWQLRVRRGGELFVFGYDSTGNGHEFPVYGSFPIDRWVDLELGLHSQAGPGVKRAFGFLINGSFYGWYHQGHMSEESYDRAAIGILSTNSNSALELFVDEWREMTEEALPSGPDARSVTAVQELDYRRATGREWQIDWSTWASNLRLDSQFGLFSENDRLQSGKNIDRMPSLRDGWAEIEIDWPAGAPPLAPSGYFGPMVGFRKEINREENLEVIPIGAGDGKVDLALEAWDGGGPVVLARWALPAASIGNTHIPEPGDIIRAEWEQASASDIRVRASYYDASTASWYYDVINHRFNATRIGGSGSFGPVDYTDSYHAASSITIDSPCYSIRRFKVGTPETAP